MQLACADKLIQCFDADPSEFFFEYTAIGRNLNLEAYRRIYPPAHMQRSTSFSFLKGTILRLALATQIRQVEIVHQRLEHLTSLDEIPHCFPYQVLRPQCAIEHFYTFYEI